MAGLIAQFGAIRLKPRRLAPFESLGRAIIYQQLSGKAAGTILARFQALFGDSVFPTPEQVAAASPERLRSTGLSRPKLKYLQGLAAAELAGGLPTLAQCDTLPDDELISRFTALHGIGRWTVEMFLIFNLGRPDVLPVHDLGVRKGFQRAYRRRLLPEPEQLDRFGRRWAPYRTTAARYLWRAADAAAG